MKKLALLVLVGAAAAAYLYHDPSLIEPFLRGTALELPARTTTIYRWRNEDGTFEHSNSPPPAGVEHQVIEVSSDTNVIPLAPQKKQ